MTKPDARELEAEAKARWGDTEQYRESARRTRKYTDADWAMIKAEAEAVEADFAELMGEGGAPADDAALSLAERARAHINQYYYACSPQMHAMLADMYTVDPRFRAHYDDRAEGLADFVAGAIKANAARLGG